MFEIKFRLREHPFYKAWEKGEITIQKLSEYAYYWQRILNEFSISDNWIKNLEKSEKYPTLLDEHMKFANKQELFYRSLDRFI
jgi:hypothetical protein